MRAAGAVMARDIQIFETAQYTFSQGCSTRRLCRKTEEPAVDERLSGKRKLESVSREKAGWGYWGQGCGEFDLFLCLCHRNRNSEDSSAGENDERTSGKAGPCCQGDSDDCGKDAEGCGRNAELG